ncbi:MAG: hypothetical protein WDW36_006451 [Sanguina aurantia]
MIARCPTTKAVSVRSISRTSAVVCRAVSETSSRRNFLGVALLPALLYVPNALALIPDEEDEELVEKAKANRKARLAQQQTTTRQFIKSEGLNDVKLDKELVPIQRAVLKLAKSGAQIEAADLKGVESTLGEIWVEEFRVQAVNVGGTVPPTKLMSSIGALKASAASGDINASKRQFVALSADLKEWVDGADLASDLKGL